MTKFTLSLSERLSSWAMNEEMVNCSFTEHGEDCLEAANIIDEVEEYTHE